MCRHPLRTSAPVLVFFLIAACDDTAAPNPITVEPTASVSLAAAPKVVPTGKGIGTRTYSPAPRTKNRIEYHRGPIMLGTNHVYYITYGNWPTGNLTEQILTDFIVQAGGSDYFRTLSAYYESAGTPLTGNFLWASNANDYYSHGTSLTDADITTIVQNMIEPIGVLPLDPQGVYVVIASPDVSVPGLGTTWCAMHNWTTVVGIRVAYAFVGAPSRNPAACASQFYGPNGGNDFDGDAMVSLVAAELANAFTSATLSGWYDRTGLEVADKCAFTYGSTYQTPNGALANVRLGSRDYLLQQLWLPGRNGGSCVLKLPV